MNGNHYSGQILTKLEF